MAQRPIVEFWYDFASTYSYLTAMRIEEAADKAGVGVLWRPFLLGPIFAAQGWTTSPFNLFPGKGRYMWRDMEREAARLKIPFYRPKPFPQNSLLAARVALLGSERGWAPTFTRLVFTEEFGNGQDIGQAEVIADILAGLGLDAAAILAEAQSDTNKLRLRRIGEEAQARGVFGAPTLIAEDGELFWGNDRLERALDWARDDRTRRADVPV
jgi:2-hydroxychromene-2-carboxylate isomerase